MEPPGGRDSRFNLGYSMNLLSGETAPEIYGNPSLGRPSTSLQQLSPRHTMVSSACGGRGLKSDMYDERGMSSQNMGLEACGVNDISEDTYSSLQSKKSPPSNGKKTKGRVKIKMEYIENKLRRYTTFSKRKTGIMKKAYELSTLTGTQVMLLVASETGHVYTFATRKLQPMITSEAGKALIQTCLNSPDPPAGSAGGDQRMSATGFEETELTYNISDEDSKDGENGVPCTSSSSSDEEEEAAEDLPESQDKIASKHHSPPKDPNSPDNKLKLKKVKLEEKEKNVNSSKNSALQIAGMAHCDSSYSMKEETSVGPPVVPASIPFLVPNSLQATVPAGLIPAGASTAQIQAVPLLLQTAAGVGYATTPDGMFVGMLQGPNINPPQLVAIPMTNVAPAVSQGPQDQRKTDNNKNENISAGDSSDSCSDGEMDTETPLSVFVPPDNPSFNTLSPPSSPYQQKQRQSSPTTPTPSSTPSSTPSTKASSPTRSQPPILSPLVYQTPQGMMYATPSTGGVILSLAQGDPNSAHPQFITIPLSMVATNGQGELDLSKRK